MSNNLMIAPVIAASAIVVRSKQYLRLERRTLSTGA
jgi:hypothetical protein